MADKARSAQDVLDDLGVPYSDHEFLRRLFAPEDPFPELSGTDLDLNATHDPNPSNRASARLNAVILSQRLAPIPTRQVISRALFDRVQHPATNLPVPGDLPHYGDEWVSLISQESITLLSNLRGHLELPEDIRRPGSNEPPGSSVYDSDRGENTQGNNIPIIPGPSGYRQESPPRTLPSVDTVGNLISSFPLPPASTPFKGKQAIAHEEQPELAESITNANIPTPDTSQSVNSPIVFGDSVVDTLAIPSPSPSSTPICTPLQNVTTPLSRASPVVSIDQDLHNTRRVGPKVPLHHPVSVYPSLEGRDRRATYALFPNPYPSPRSSFSSTIRRVQPIQPYCEATDHRFYRKTPFLSPASKSTYSFGRKSAQPKGCVCFKRCFSRAWTRISSLCTC
ncbi:hypothetical protein PENANT_c019G00597 [Penicillium antarcticum]|uniref:Uncharacterized protein n=1 Tax=Penicillium antarcticum TaxID=416450 RepID=A0A1V6Q107_9EURO|nr:hypothetical protein PENANT_c019G00597 [Penicillium antarcticum]